MRRPIRSAALACGAALAALVAALPAGPAAADAPPLVRAPALAAPPAPSGSVATGSLPSDQPVPIRVVLPSTDQPGIQRLLQSIEDPGSPSYHHWLAPGQFAARFGPSPTSVAAVESWLRGRGLSGVSASGFAVRASGDASTVSGALGVHFHRYRSPNGHRGYRATGAPLVPPALASGQVQAIVGLDSTTPFQPQVVPSSPPGGAPSAVPGISQPATGPAADGLSACPAAKSVAQSVGGSGGYTLDEIGAAYGIGSLLADGQNGRGQTVAVYELSPSSSADVAAYKSCFGLTNPVSVVKVAGGGSSSQLGTLEADLDIEQVATQAPGASVISYEGPNNSAGGYDTWYAIVSADMAKVVSTSWGDCGDAELSAYDPLFQAAALQGQTILAASGDHGSEDCYDPPNGVYDTSLAVDYPASSSYVTAVGGTSYAPGNEVVWNECQTATTTACAAGDRDAGGGGVANNIPEPSWQPANQYSTPKGCAAGCRAVPDISANAAVNMVVYDASYGGWTVVGGTSAAAPLVAGLVADRNVGCTTGTGDLAPTLYRAAAQGLYGAGLTDITSGDNDLTRTNGGKYPAGAGYDPATGLGSPLAAGLSCPEVTGLSPSTALGGSTVTISGLGLEHAAVSFGGVAATITHASATSATVTVPTGAGTVAVSASSTLGAGTAHGSFTYGRPPAVATTGTTLASSVNPANAGQQVTFTATVTASSGATPTGQVAFAVDGSAKVCGDQNLASAGNRATATCRVAFPKAGTSHVVQAAYRGTDGEFYGSTAARLVETVRTMPAVRSSLQPGQTLTVNQSLTSGTYRLAMQPDGNLVEYQRSRALWASGTSGHPGTGVVMQKNGDLVEYSHGRAIWASNTAGHPGAHLTLQASDGNVVIYAPGGRALWATGT